MPVDPKGKKLVLKPAKNGHKGLHYDFLFKKLNSYQDPNFRTPDIDMLIPRKFTVF